MRAELPTPGAARPAMLPGALVPEWAAGGAVGALVSGRDGGVSTAPWASLNLGAAVGDAAAAVQANRGRFAAALGAVPVFLKQVHGTRVVRVGRADADAPPQAADAAWTDEPGVACTVLVADCLPLLLAAPGGRAVAAVHAGWRGLAGGVAEVAIAALCEAAGCEPAALAAWLGPCIGPSAFEVGADVLAAFGADAAQPEPARFRFRPRPDGSPRWLADLPGLALDRLAAAGVRQVDGGRWCTVSEPSRFFSFRRDGLTGRFGAAVWRLG